MRPPQTGSNRRNRADRVPDCPGSAQSLRSGRDAVPARRGPLRPRSLRHRHRRPRSGRLRLDRRCRSTAVRRSSLASPRRKRRVWRHRCDARPRHRGCVRRRGSPLRLRPSPARRARHCRTVRSTAGRHRGKTPRSAMSHRHAAAPASWRAAPRTRSHGDWRRPRSASRPSAPVPARYHRHRCAYSRCPKR